MITYHNFTSQWLSSDRKCTPVMDLGLSFTGTQDINEKRGPMHVSLGPRKKVINLKMPYETLINWIKL